MSSVDGDTKLSITDTIPDIPIVTLSTKDNLKLLKQLNNGFKQSVYWNEYRSHVLREPSDNNDPIRIKIDAAFQGVNAFNNFANNLK